MTQDPSSGLTDLLRRASAGDRGAADAALAAVYEELKRSARRLMRDQPKHHVLEPECLLHEAYLKVQAAGAKDWANRGHFIAVMARAMRQHLIDHARHEQRQKCGGALKRVPLTGILLTFENRVLDLLTLADALEKLASEHPDSADVIELTYFAGLSAGEVAAALGIAPRTVVRELKFARAWLEAEFSR